MINRSFFLFLAGFVLSADPSKALLFNEADMSHGNVPHIHYTQSYTIEAKPASLENSYKIAAICFLGVGDCGNQGGYSSDAEDMNIDTAKQCLNEGFVPNNCNNVQEADAVCPYNEDYIKGCKCKTDLVACPDGQLGLGDSCDGKYVTCQCDETLVSCASNQNGGGASCGGRYEYCTCKPEYIYSADNCTDPRYLTGAVCGGKYTGCTCPTPETCEYGCKEYYASPCGSVCASCNTNPDCDVVSENCPYGCASYNSCDKCASCNGNPDCDIASLSCPYGCSETNSCDKCTSCKDNPDCNITSLSCPYGCALENSCDKCISCKSNPDCDVTSQTCSYGCASENSCGKCTSCKENPDCEVTSLTCSNGCATTNSCGKCTACKACTPTCTNESGCSWGTATKSNGCGGTCIECLPKCQSGYTYGYTPSDCYITPATHMYQSTNKNCGKCVCNNANTNCGGKPCSCMIF